MPDDLAARAHAIFTRALDLDGEARAAMAREACAGDAELLARVTRLLRAASESEGFLETPALASPDAAPAPDFVGSYLVTGVLGTGGMATVYEAVQENPRRRVAIKVMHRSLERTDALLRFRLEAQTLAQLQHPAIAQIFEAGTAQLGRASPSPFLVMELIPGARSVTEHAERRGLTLRERLALFASVCDAVEHAHQHGVIHRDLKPANVLVGESGAAKVIDFGIARSEGAGQAAAADEARGPVGTLSAMSPEQCDDGAGLDVRTDVYSLGVILYQLVAGRPPHDLSRCTLAEALRIIREESPAPVESLRPEARGRLAAIVAKAMAKDRSARYAGAGALAADVRRCLAHRPVEARRSGAGEQAVLFTRRSPALAGAIAAAALLLVSGAALSTGLAVVAGRARDAALRRERDLEAVTEFQQSMLGGLDVRAMGERLRESVASSLREHAERSGDENAPPAEGWESLTGAVNFTTVALDLLDASVLERYRGSIDERFADRPLIRARLLHQLSGTMRGLGLHADALAAIQLAHDIRREQLGDDHTDTLLSRSLLGATLSALGRYDEALTTMEDAYEGLRRTLGPDHPRATGAGTTLGGLYRLTGRLDDAERVWLDTLERQRRTLGEADRATLRTLNNMGVLYAVQGKTDLAEASWRAVIAAHAGPGAEDRSELRSAVANLGSLLRDAGRLEEAEPLLRESLALERRRLGDRHTETLMTMSMLAALLREKGDLQEAETLLRECVEGRSLVLPPEHPDLLRVRALLGATLHARGDREAGERMLREAIEAQERVLGERDLDYTDSLALLRDVAAASGRLEEAIEHGARAVRLAREGPGTKADVGDLVAAQGAALLEAGRLEEAGAALREGLALLTESRGASHPRTRTAAANLARWTARTGGDRPESGGVRP